MTKQLIIARHGNTFGPGDTPTRVGKRTDLPLVASGRAQAERMGRYLHEHDLRPDRAYCSTLQRTQQMIDGINDATGWTIPYSAKDALDEIDYGEDENQPEDAVIARIGADAIARWDADATPPDGWQVDVAAITASWQALAQELLEDDMTHRLLIVTSNGIARFAPYILADADSFFATHPIKLKTGALCLCEHNGQGWECVFWNVRP